MASCLVKINYTFIFPHTHVNELCFNTVDDLNIVDTVDIVDIVDTVYNKATVKEQPYGHNVVCYNARSIILSF